MSLVAPSTRVAAVRPQSSDDDDEPCFRSGSAPEPGSTARCARTWASTPDRGLYARLTKYFSKPRSACPARAGILAAPGATAAVAFPRRPKARPEPPGLFFPGHPTRHLLNAVVALHECDGARYREMATAPTGWALAVSAIGWVLAFAASSW